MDFPSWLKSQQGSTTTTTHEPEIIPPYDFDTNHMKSSKLASESEESIQDAIILLEQRVRYETNTIIKNILTKELEEWQHEYDRRRKGTTMLDAPNPPEVADETINFPPLSPSPLLRGDEDVPVNEEEVLRDAITSPPPSTPPPPPPLPPSTPPPLSPLAEMKLHSLSPDSIPTIPDDPSRPTIPVSPWNTTLQSSKLLSITSSSSSPLVDVKGTHHTIDWLIEHSVPATPLLPSEKVMLSPDVEGLFHLTKPTEKTRDCTCHNIFTDSSEWCMSCTKQYATNAAGHDLSSFKVGEEFDFDPRKVEDLINKIDCKHCRQSVSTQFQNLTEFAITHDTRVCTLRVLNKSGNNKTSSKVIVDSFKDMKGSNNNNTPITLPRTNDTATRQISSSLSALCLPQALAQLSDVFNMNVFMASKHLTPTDMRMFAELLLVSHHISPDTAIKDLETARGPSLDGIHWNLVPLLHDNMYVNLINTFSKQLSELCNRLDDFAARLLVAEDFLMSNPKIHKLMVKWNNAATSNEGEQDADLATAITIISKWRQLSALCLINFVPRTDNMVHFLTSGVLLGPFLKPFIEHSLREITNSETTITDSHITQATNKALIRMVHVAQLYTARQELEIVCRCELPMLTWAINHLASSSYVLVDTVGTISDWQLFRISGHMYDLSHARLASSLRFSSLSEFCQQYETKLTSSAPWSADGMLRPMLDDDIPIRRGFSYKDALGNDDASILNLLMAQNEATELKTLFDTPLGTGDKRDRKVAEDMAMNKLCKRLGKETCKKHGFVEFVLPPPPPREPITATPASTKATTGKDGKPTKVATPTAPTDANAKKKLQDAEKLYQNAVDAERDRWEKSVKVALAKCFPKQVNDGKQQSSSQTRTSTTELEAIGLGYEILMSKVETLHKSFSAGKKIEIFGNHVPSPMSLPLVDGDASITPTTLDDSYERAFLELGYVSTPLKKDDKAVTVSKDKSLHNKKEDKSTTAATTANKPLSKSLTQEQIKEGWAVASTMTGSDKLISKLNQVFDLSQEIVNSGNVHKAWTLLPHLVSEPTPPKTAVRAPIPSHINGLMPFSNELDHRNNPNAWVPTILRVQTYRALNSRTRSSKDLPSASGLIGGIVALQDNILEAYRLCTCLRIERLTAGGCFGCTVDIPSLRSRLLQMDNDHEIGQFKLFAVADSKRATELVWKCAHERFQRILQESIITDMLEQSFIRDDDKEKKKKEETLKREEDRKQREEAKKREREEAELQKKKLQAEAKRVAGEAKAQEDRKRLEAKEAQARKQAQEEVERHAANVILLEAQRAEARQMKEKEEEEAAAAAAAALERTNTLKAIVEKPTLPKQENMPSGPRIWSCSTCTLENSADTIQCLGCEKEFAPWEQTYSVPGTVAKGEEFDQVVSKTSFVGQQQQPAVPPPAPLSAPVPTGPSMMEWRCDRCNTMCASHKDVCYKCQTPRKVRGISSNIPLLCKQY